MDRNVGACTNLLWEKEKRRNGGTERDVNFVKTAHYRAP
jgi:hypothetical protein